MVREPLTLLFSASQEPYRPDAKTLQHQEELRLIFKRQQEKGGIIDPEAERNRYFISLQAVGHRGRGSAELRAGKEACGLQGQALSPASGPSSPFLNSRLLSFSLRLLLIQARQPLPPSRW